MTVVGYLSGHQRCEIRRAFAVAIFGFLRFFFEDACHFVGADAHEIGIAVAIAQRRVVGVHERLARLRVDCYPEIDERRVARHGARATDAQQSRVMLALLVIEVEKVRPKVIERPNLEDTGVREPERRGAVVGEVRGRRVSGRRLGAGGHVVDGALAHTLSMRLLGAGSFFRGTGVRCYEIFIGVATGCTQISTRGGESTAKRFSTTSRVMRASST